MVKKLKDIIKTNPTQKPTFGTNPSDPWSTKAGLSETTDKKDTVVLDIPLLIRVLELAREDIKSDMDLHRVVEKLISIRNKGVLTMDDYNTIAQIKENHIAIAMGNMMDDEGSMVLNQLEQLERACAMIRSYVGKDYEKQLPAWVQSKITLATDYIDTAGNYLVSKNEKVTEEVVNEVSKKKLYDYMMKAGSKNDPKKNTKDRGMNVVKATGKYLNKEETEHKVGDSVTVNSKFFGKKKGIVKKVDSQSVHVQRDGNKFSEKYPHDAVMKEEMVNEMDKSQTPPGRDGNEPYDYNKGKWTRAKMMTSKDVVKDMGKELNKAFGKSPEQKKVKEEVLDELNYDTVKSLYQKRRADFHGAQVGKKKKGKDVSAKNVSTSISRMMGHKPTQNQPQKEEVEQIDELNYDTVDSYNSKRKANPSSKKSSEVTTKNKLTTNDRLFGKKPTQNSPMQGVKRELTPQQKTLQKDYHDSQRRGMSTEEVVNEQDPCWTGYTQVGMKKKGGRQVPNCVPSKGVPKAKGYKEEVVNELSNELLGTYKKKAGEQASAADKAGDFKKGNKRFSGIVKATKKQFANDVKEETLDELNKDTLKNYLNKSTEIRKDSKSELKDIEKRPEMYKDNTGRDQQNIATRANKLKTTITKRTTGLNRAFNKLHGVAEAVDKKEMSKSARMIKALYKHHNVKEDMMDWEKGDKSTQSYGKKPNFKMAGKNIDTSDTKSDARAVMKGGTTLTGQPRDMVEIDPSMKQRPGGQNTFTKDNTKKAPNN
jgi:hypothetical protein